MLDSFEINDSFDNLFDFNSEDESPIKHNSKKDLNFLNAFFEPLIAFNLELAPSSANASLIKFYNQLKNNQFKDATQTISDEPCCLQQINDSLPAPELAAFFLFLLRKKLTFIVKSMWSNNTLFASYFSGKLISVELTNAKGVIDTKTWQLTMPESIANFKTALTSQHSAIIKSMWDNNTLLASYFSGQPISVPLPNAQGAIDTETWQLTMPELIANFNAALTSQCSAIIKSMWDNNALLASYFSGNSISVQLPNADGTFETQIWQLSIQELVVNFKAALAGRTHAIIKSIWENSALLALYFSGKPIQIEALNAQGNIETQTWQLTMPDLMTNFKAALASQSAIVIKSMWNNNALLTSYFSGKPIQIEALNTQGTITTQTWQLTALELMTNFKAALAARTQDIIYFMWDNENSPLQNMIQTLDETGLIALTEKVLTSSKPGKNEFITTFLSFISNKRILEACLNKRVGKKQSLYTKKQISSLTNRLASINASLEPLIIDDSQTCNGRNSETSLIDNNEFNNLLCELIADANETSVYSDSTPLVNNSMFNKHKRSYQTPSDNQHKFQKTNDLSANFL